MQKFWKRITSVFLFIFLISAAGITAAAADIGVNIIPNNGFEELDKDGIPKSWDAYVDWDEGFGFVETAKPYAGKYSIGVELTEDRTRIDGKLTYPWVKTRITDFTPGALYEVRCMANWDFVEGGNWRILIESYNSNAPDKASAYMQGDYPIHMAGSTNNQWEEVTGMYQAPKEATLLQVYVYLRGAKPGMVKVDNLELVESGGPDPYKKFTDEVFYYEDDTMGYSSVEIDSYYEPGDPEYAATVDFALKDGDKVLKEAKGVTFQDDGRAMFPFEVSLLTELEKEYRVDYTVHAPDGTVLEEYSDEVYKYPRPTALTRDGLYIDENGEIFHPVLVYHPGDIADFAPLKEMGINLVELGLNGMNLDIIRNKLDALHALGMKAVIQLCGNPAAYMEPAGHPKNIEGTIEVIETFRDHPAVFSWSPQDEPFGGSLNEERVRDMRNSYKIIRELDKHRPVMLVDYMPSGYRDSQKYCDVWMADRYVIGDTLRITNDMRAAVEAAKGRKPTMYVGQSYKSSAGFPTITDIRGSTYRALEEGCTMVGWYEVDDAIVLEDGTRVPLHATELAAPMGDFIKNELSELFKYFSEKKYPTFNRSTDKDVHSLAYGSWVNNGELWIYAHNRGNETITAEVPLVSDNGLVKVNGGTAKAMGGTDVDLTVTGGVLKTEIIPQEVHLYKMKPDAEINLDTLAVEVQKPSEAYNGKFEDLTGYEWAVEAIEAMFSAGIANDTTMYSYSPGKNISRGDFAMFLMRALGLSAEGEGFADVPADAPYAKEVTTGRALGILEGVGENCFNPEAEISRQDMMKMAARAMRHAKKLSEISNPAVLEAFYDKASIADYAVADVAAMVEAGIIKGNADGTINPFGNTTRAEAAVIMDRIIKAETVQKAPEKEEPKEEDLPVVFAKETVSEEQSVKRANAMDALRQLNIADMKDSEAVVTRGEAARLIARFMGYTGEILPEVTPFADVSQQHPESGYIEMVNRLGYMNGTGENTFSPDMPVQYNQMVKILVDALGYTAHAKANGGYSAGYLFMANQLEITDGISVHEDGPIPAGTVALLLRNALDAPVAQRTSFGTDKLEFTSADAKTALTVYHGLTRYDGRITATSAAMIEAPRMLHAGEVAMGQMIFYAGNSGAETAFGQTVVVYAKESADGTPQMILCEGKRATKVITLDAGDLLPEKSNTAMLYWHDENYKEYSEVFDSDAVLVYNGKAKSSFDSKDFDISDGTVTLLCGNGGITTVMIDEYVNHIVSAVSTTFNTIHFEDGSSIEVDPNNNSKKISIVKQSGEELAINKIKKGNVASVSKSQDGSIVKLVISDVKVTGTVTECDQTYVFINGTRYVLASNLKNPASGVKVPTLGEEAAYTLDKAGKIASVGAAGNETLYGYLIAMQKGNGLSGAVKLRLFTAEGKMEYPLLAETVNLNGTSMKAAKVYEDASLRTILGELMPQLVVYEKNEAGEINVLKTARIAEGTDMDEAQRLSEFTLDWTSAGKSAAERFLRSRKYCIADYHRWDDNTVIFCVPSGNEAREDKYYSIYDKSQIAGSTAVNIPNLHLYDIDENLYTPVVVSKTVISADSSTVKDPTWCYNEPDGYLLVKEFRQVLNEDDEVINAIAGWNNEGKEVVVPVQPDMQIKIHDKTLTTEKIPEDFAFNVSDLNPGDIIYYEEDPYTKELVAARVMFRCNTPQVQEKSTHGNVSATWNWSEGAVYSYGKVLGVLDTGLHTEAQFKRLWAWINFGNNDAPILLCKKTGTDAEGHATYDIQKITRSDIAKGDMAFSGATQHSTQMFVIYR